VKEDLIMNDELKESDLRDRDLKDRTKGFALRIIKLYSALPKHGAGQVLGNQILKSGTSPGAQYREAQRAKSDADFISKIEGALQELDETIYWLELIGESGIVPERRLQPLLNEAEELIAIFVTIVLRVKQRGRPRSR
jgi:four helix bundle protein